MLVVDGKDEAHPVVPRELIIFPASANKPGVYSGAVCFDNAFHGDAFKVPETDAQKFGHGA
jgi:hypothetical protein